MSPIEPEDSAREHVDSLLRASSRHVCDPADFKTTAHRGAAIPELPLANKEAADYRLYVYNKAAGLIEAKKVGTTLTGVEIQSAKPTQRSLMIYPRGSDSSRSSMNVLVEKFSAALVKGQYAKRSITRNGFLCMSPFPPYPSNAQVRNQLTNQLVWQRNWNFFVVK